MSSTEVPSFPERDDIRSLLCDEPLVYDRSARSAFVATGSAATLGIGLDLMWMAQAPPQALGFGWACIGLALIAAAGSAIGASSAARRAVSAWAGLFSATLLGLVMFGWVLVFPGVSFGLFALVIMLGMAVALTALVVALVIRFGSARRDCVAGLMVVAGALVGCAVLGVDFGRDLRLALVRERYEAAAEEGRVEKIGGFTTGPVSAWVWIGGVLNAAGVMAFDPTDTLEAHEVAAQLVAYIGNPECERVEPQWFWCSSS